MRLALQTELTSQAGCGTVMRQAFVRLWPHKWCWPDEGQRWYMRHLLTGFQDGIGGSVFYARASRLQETRG